MDTKAFRGNAPGECISISDGNFAFVPNPLPPNLDYDARLRRLLSQADLLVGELSGIGRVLKNPYLLIGPYIRREAVSSSRIEGTQSSLNDLFFYEAMPSAKPRVPDVREVTNYVRAMETGLELREKLPISVRLIRCLHRVLLDNVRGESTNLGQIRRDQNWIGPTGCSISEATFVPPPPKPMLDALSDWERYLHSDPEDPPLVQCALTHYQFEAIHPFLDGNGRIGRLLITLFLCDRGIPSQPLLYLSAYFERSREEYYRRLITVSQTGDWYGWLEFFLRGVIAQAGHAIADSKRILALHEEYQERIRQTKRVPETAHRLIDEIFISPVVSISGLSKKWDVSFNAVKTGVKRLLDVGILLDVGQVSRGKLYIAHELTKLLSGSSSPSR